MIIIISFSAQVAQPTSANSSSGDDFKWLVNEDELKKKITNCLGSKNDSILFFFRFLIINTIRSPSHYQNGHEIEFAGNWIQTLDRTYQSLLD